MCKMHENVQKRYDFSLNRNGQNTTATLVAPMDDYKKKSQTMVW